MTVKELPNHEYLKSILKYFPHNGAFVYRVSRGNRKRGSLANYKGSQYHQISLDGKLYVAHRLAYYYVTGIDPIGLVVDHIDRNKHNNVFSNLRAVPISVNNLNHGRSPAYCSRHRDKWEAQYTFRGKHYYCGLFSTQAEATAAALSSRNHEQAKTTGKTTESDD